MESSGFFLAYMPRRIASYDERVEASFFHKWRVLSSRLVKNVDQSNCQKRHASSDGFRRSVCCMSDNAWESAVIHLVLYYIAW